MSANQILVNKLGYLPDGPKQVTVICDTSAPLGWELYHGGSPSNGKIAAGHAPPQVFDPTVGEEVQTITLPRHLEPGSYQLFTAGQHKRISVASRLYDQVLFDSLLMFRLQRSGYEITAEVAGPQYAREAGHLNVPPNLGDSSISPLPRGGGTTDDGVDLYDGWSGDYQADVAGGWYDAGDAGKYVVNGGISVAQLLGVVERLMKLPHSQQESALNLALNESMWELDWMSRMQVAEGLPYAGMLHHKVSDEHWTAIPTLPADDPQPRYLHRPSTSATLNFAAVAAQAARVILGDGTELRRRYLTAARRAYAAAKANPVLLAPDSNVLPNPGSGPYNDKVITDEWYWAAAELYLVTGDNEYLADLRANPYHIPNPTNADQTESPWSEVGFDWRDTTAWARIELCLALAGHDPNCAKHGEISADFKTLRQELLNQADKLIAQQQPFGQLYSPADNRYAWGSNGMIANNAAIVAAAYELTGDEKYRDAALAGIDYLFGRNALDISYVTGYGDNYVKNQHSRWFAHQVDPSLPNPPKGTLSGGPNSDVPDPAAAHLKGQPAQYCFVDDIASYGTNEMTINWNAALAYLLSFAVTV